MDQLIFARSQMALSLAFHIVFACIGMVMPFLMSRSYWLYLKTKDSEYLTLTKLWMKGVAIFFAVGAVSGTALSFELGLLWPQFMEKAGPIIGMPFSWEGAAFFAEAIFLGIFLYGEGRIPPMIHWFCSLMVGVAGVFSGIFVVSANAWMNSPAGFSFRPDGSIDPGTIDPYKAMFNAAWPPLALHMVLAAFCATGLAVLGMHAWLLFKGKNPSLNRKAIACAYPFFIISSLLMPVSGDFCARRVVEHQPEKLAAMEAHFHTEKGASLIIGGIPNLETHQVDYALKIPKLLSLFAKGDMEAEVKGWLDFPEKERPPITIPHYAFQTMVGLGFTLATVSLFLLACFFIRPEYLYRPLTLRLLALLTPCGFICLEAGWVVTEVGRQPWIIYKVMKVQEALTPMQGMQFSFFMYLALYGFLTFVVTWLFTRQLKASGNL